MENPYDDDDFRTPAWNLLSDETSKPSTEDVDDSYSLLARGLEHLHRDALSANNPLFILWSKAACRQTNINELTKDIASIHAAWSQFFNWLITLHMVRQMEDKFDIEPMTMEEEDADTKDDSVSD